MSVDQRAASTRAAPACACTPLASQSCSASRRRMATDDTTQMLLWFRGTASVKQDMSEKAVS